MSIYFSTGGYKYANSYKIVKKLIESGINFIELSGTKYSSDNIEKISKLKDLAKFQIRIIFLHLKIQLF